MKNIFIFLIFFNATFLFSQSNDKPNFVVIFCDDLGYGDIGVFGSPIIRTPNLDQMATEGQKWTQFYVADPVCTPSRAALMTGRYPIRSGMTSSKRAVLFPNSANGLKQEEVTIAEVLKDQGYATGAVGKWHLGHLPKYLPINQGFDSYFGIPYSNDMNKDRETSKSYRENLLNPNFKAPADQYNIALVENTIEIERPVDQTTITKRYTKKAVEFIDKNKNQSFFLYLAHSMPHIPLFASDDFMGRSKASLYVDVIEEIDWSVGQVLEALKRNNLDENTVVVFSSDNGPWLSFKMHGGSAGPLRGGKGTTFEGGQRVPTVFWGPGLVEPGVVNQMGSTLDLINTFASLSGGKVPQDRKMDGYDLSKVLTEKAVSPRKDFYYWGFAQLHGYRTEQFKLHIKQREPVYYGRPTIILDTPELYNLRADISEKYDVAMNHPDLVDKMLHKIDEHLKDVEGSTPDQLVERLPKK